MCTNFVLGCRRPPKEIQDLALCYRLNLLQEFPLDKDVTKEEEHNASPTTVVSTNQKPLQQQQQKQKQTRPHPRKFLLLAIDYLGTYDQAPKRDWVIALRKEVVEDLVSQFPSLDYLDPAKDIWIDYVLRDGVRYISANVRLLPDSPPDDVESLKSSLCIGSLHRICGVETKCFLEEVSQEVYERFSLRGLPKQDRFRTSGSGQYGRGKRDGEFHGHGGGGHNKRRRSFDTYHPRGGIGDGRRPWSHENRGQDDRWHHPRQQSRPRQYQDQERHQQQRDRRE